jgi:hypothetical protein
MLGSHLSVMYINVKKARKGTELTIKRNWQYLVHKKQDENKQNKNKAKNTTQKTKEMSNADLTKNRE